MSKISVDLSVKGIEKLKRYLLDYKSDLNSKLKIFVNEVAKLGIPVIETKIAEANYTYDEDNIQSGSDTTHKTYINLVSSGDYAEATLIVEGEEILFIEFGAGVSYNTPKGTSPHELGSQYKFLIGTYGKGYGARQIWGYYDDGGELVLTRGTKATMPMWEAKKVIRNSENVISIARKVFGGN